MNLDDKLRTSLVRANVVVIAQGMIGRSKTTLSVIVEHQPGRCFFPQLWVAYDADFRIQRVGVAII